ncbi:hypothetical protein RJ639_010856 [Escallonia herrerae]|uniref:Membrane-associated kinase regulator 2 n=1 Tax=Escallonia herrerae TaxID=1293975 RepID=A0AA88VM53_9ASTE|nr:hypothetical protein RJ639_010856 [Escallonia herrerae]
MEVFSLLKFWRNAGSSTDHTSGEDLTNTSVTTSIDSRDRALETDEETEEDEDSFFDLVLAAPDNDLKQHKSRSGDVSFLDIDEDLHYNNNLSKRAGQTNCSNFVASSPNDVLHKKNSKTHPPISLLRSPPNFRVLMLGFKKSKVEKIETNGFFMATPKHESSRFSVKCKVEEVQISSLFARDNSLRSQLRREGFEAGIKDEPSKRFSKDVVQKYLNLIKPFYVKGPRRSGEKARFSDAVTPMASPATASAFSPRKNVEEKQGSRVAGFREVCRQLGKSRSASSAGRVLPTPSTVRRRDDTILEQQDGIQSAILHCKRSYSSSSSSQDCSLLSRSASDSCEKSMNPSRSSTEDERRSSI